MRRNLSTIVFFWSGCAVMLLAVASGQAAPEFEAVEPDFSWRQTETSIALVSRGKAVWRHVHDKKMGKPYMRFGLIDGTELTRPCPMPKGYPKADHVWHRALWWSWKSINGVNYWEENRQGTEPVAVNITTNKDGSAQIDLKIAYHKPNEPPVVNEEREIRIGRPDTTGTYLIAWRATFTPAGSKDVVFNRNSYGGFAIRMAAEFCGGVDDDIAAWKFIQSDEPKGRKPPTARWMAYHGVAQNGRPSAIAIFTHPDNPRHPSAWQTRNHYPYLNPSFTCYEDYTLPAGKSLTLRYGVLVLDGAADPLVIERAWNAFAKPAGTTQ